MLAAILLIVAGTAHHAAAPVPPRSAVRSCFLSVDRKIHVNGRCLVFPMGRRGFTLNTWDRGKPRAAHFAIVEETAPGRGVASWNRDPDDDRAGDPLGAVRWQKGCWVSARVRICAR